MGAACDAWRRKTDYRVLVDKSEEKKPLGIQVSRNEDNIKMRVKEIGWEGMDRIHLARES
jgi:hypothetical protein